MRFIVNILTLFIIGGFGFPGSTGADDELPFREGEKLKYDLKWTIIKAGEATLEVLPIENVEGSKAYHFVMTARSTPFLDVFYKVRDRIDAYTDIKMTRSVFYKKKQREGRTHRDIQVRFDWERKEAHYTNFGKKRDPLSLMPGAFDPLSAFYFIRLSNLRENMVIERPVTDGKKCVIGRAKVVGREKIKVGERTYDTWLIEPELEHVGGVFEKSKDAKIQLWVSADKWKIPIRIKSKVVVGSFSGELVSAEGLR